MKELGSELRVMRPAAAVDRGQLVLIRLEKKDSKAEC